MFKDFKKQFQDNFTALIQGQSQLYVVDVSKDELWDTYLNGFSEDVRQEFNCNSCRQFIKNYGAVVAIKNNKIKTIWDFIPTEHTYDVVTTLLNAKVSSAPIRDIFVTKQAKLGTDSNVQLLDIIKDGVQTKTWQHLYFQLPTALVSRSSVSEETIMGAARDIKNVFKRSLEEITLGAIDTVLELIASNSLYRGSEHKYAVESFREVKIKYSKLNNSEKDNFCWANSSSQGISISKIRNTSIGTLLVDISNDVDLDEAVRKFERVMAPANYKRPNPILSKKMIEDAERVIKEEGLEDSLPRRFAIPEDVTVNNVLFVDRDAKKALAGDVFGQLKENLPVNPKSFSKVEEISGADFINKVLPKADSVEVFFENKHISNLVSLIAPQNKFATPLFKWDNNFSWSYKDAVADSMMKQRVKEAGGKIDGVLRFSIQWNEDGQVACDLDAHAYEPGGEHIGYNTLFRKDRGGNPRTRMSGQLDVDMINPRSVGVENIVWDDLSKMKDGTYRLSINAFSGVNKGFNAEVEFNGEIHSFGYSKKFTNSINVADVTLKNGVFSIKPLIESSGSVVPSKNVWGIDTSKFQKVSMIMKSPNYWDGKGVGNEHLFFIIDGAKNDEVVRGFFNEFLKPELDKHRKVFEALGGKMKVEPTDKQLSGLGFSSTTKPEIIVKVTGATTRTLKVKF